MEQPTGQRDGDHVPAWEAPLEAAGVLQLMDKVAPAAALLIELCKALERHGTLTTAPRDEQIFDRNMSAKRVLKKIRRGIRVL